MKLQLSVQYAVARTGLPAKPTIRRWAQAAMKGLRRRRAALGVRIVGSAEAASLNARFRHKRYPTNVLSFPFEAPPGACSELLGDLVICAPVVAREACGQHKELLAHYAHLVIHAVLHLQGYEHEEVMDAEEMEKLETAFLAKLGYADPYAAISEIK